MSSTIVEKIIASHSGRDQVKPGEIVELKIDVRVARDFGGANVVKEIEEHGLGVDDPGRTFFTFDCNPTGSDQKYATNQQVCRQFARKWGIRVYDIDAGIGTHLAIDEGLVGPGDTFVSTDSHANILGAIGAFGQGMGDKDIAYAWAKGRVWFEVPPTVRIELVGMPRPDVSPKDVGLALLRYFGASGLLGCAAEVYGEYAETLSLDGRITISSLGTEMGAIIIIFPPSPEVVEYCRRRTGRRVEPVFAHPDAQYCRTERIDLGGIEPLISRPGHPEDVVPVSAVAGRKIDSVFIGSCTNGRIEDLRAAARILEGKKVAPGVVLKVVPATDAIWQECLKNGLMEIFKRAGALVGNAGCAGCAAGQIGQNGPGEVTVSTGNRNFTGKQGKGEVYLASPQTAAASAVAGVIASADRIPSEPAVFVSPEEVRTEKPKPRSSDVSPRSPVITGRVWVVKKDNIDTDQIYHNRHLTVTDIQEMGQYAFGNLPGWEDFPKKAKPGDIIVTGDNFGAGSSRQQAVDCFKSLGIALIIAKSFGAIYFRNAVNAGLAVMVADLLDQVENGDTIEVNLKTGEILVKEKNIKVQAKPLSPVQLAIFQRGGLLE
ncbi:MAG: aconitase/3-isopropylmalate dehydratase large subunit family protein [candidate division WOR-3 bacterium]|jgi:homoaconitate hydratase family protein/3-isopropylmalate dehydratase small subunit